MTKIPKAALRGNSCASATQKHTGSSPFLRKTLLSLRIFKSTFITPIFPPSPPLFFLFFAIFLSRVIKKKKKKKIHVNKKKYTIKC